MKNNYLASVPDRTVRRISRHAHWGYSAIELILSLALAGVLVSLAIPQYQEAIDKRRVAKGGEQIAAFVNRARSESVKRNKRIAVSYALRNDGHWCLGAALGNTPCDCTRSDANDPRFCAIESLPWQLSEEFIPIEHLVGTVAGDGSFTIDPVRGILVDPRDTATLGLQSGKGVFRMNLRVVPTGKPSLCVVSRGHGLAGYKSCTS